MKATGDKMKANKGKTKLMWFLLLSPLFLVIAFAAISEARPDYGLSQGTFAALPAMPSNFQQVEKEINKSMLFDVGEEYWKQPEFYPTFEKFIPLMKKPPAERIAIWGVGIYPARHEYRAQKGSEFTATVYLHASWLVQTYQGAKLVAEYDKRYFDVSVSPDIVLLGPAYPKFDKNWAQKITVKVRVKEVPKGVHYIIVNPKAPPDEKILEWRSKYKGLYDSMPASSPEQPYLRIAVNIK